MNVFEIIKNNFLIAVFFAITVSANAQEICSEDGQVGCVASKEFPAIDGSIISPDSIKSGVVIGGVVGTGADGQQDFCSSSGEQNCIATEAFKAVEPSTINTYDLLKGVTVAGIEGSIQRNCRGGADLSAYDNITPPAVAGLDPYDTNRNAEAAYQGPDAPWGSDYLCNGGQWIDVTSDGACDSLGDDCVYLDQYADLYWSEMTPGNSNWDMASVGNGVWPCGSNADCTHSNDQVTNVGTAGTYSNGSGVTWFDAIYACEQLNFNGRTNWRLPTHKELIQAHLHGIKVHHSVNFGDFSWTSSNNEMWASTTDPNKAGGVIVDISYGHVSARGKTLKRKFMCVSE